MWRSWKGPDLAKDGVVCWRWVDLARVIKAQFNVTLAERGVGPMLRGLISGAWSVPAPSAAGPDGWEAHKNFADPINAAIPEPARETDRTLAAR